MLHRPDNLCRLGCRMRVVCTTLATMYWHLERVSLRSCSPYGFAGFFFINLNQGLLCQCESTCPNTNWKPTCSCIGRLPPGEWSSGYCTVWTNGPWVECKHLHKYSDKILYNLYLGCDCYHTLFCAIHTYLKGSVEKGDNRFWYPKRSKVNEAFSL